jgi:transmembrane sensor
MSTSFRDLSQDQQRRLEEASEWRLRLGRDPSLGEGSEYRQWASDPLNASASKAVDQAWDSVGALESGPEMLEFRRQALWRLHRAGASRRHTRNVRLTAAVAAALGLVAIGAALLYLNQYLPTYYKTDIGERRVVALPDGSRISMDSDTQIRVTYRKATRSITLDRGRSRFDVAHDSSRPFTVAVGAQTVVAVGTSFDVERLQSTVLITLIQGQVVIKGAEPTLTAPTISLKAGEELVVSGDVRTAIIAADPQVARAWEAGRLLFRDEPLGDAVARVNRYTAHAIKVDPSIASIRISGVFNAGDIGSFVSAVTSYFPVQASTARDDSILLQPRS